MDYIISYRQGIITVTFKVDPQLLHQLEKYAIEHKISRSEAIRRAITHMIKTTAN
jgi:metal-responsive CopG/Arc/MetJ family transcriptional regulator